MQIQSVSRAIDILGLFSQDRPRMGVTEIAKALMLNTATAFGLITTLQQRGLLVKDPESKRYGLGPRLFELGTIQLWSQRLYQVGVYPVHRLSEAANKSTRLYSWEKGDMLLILQVFHPSENFPFGGAFSPKLPLYCSGAGKAILAWLPEVELTDYLKRTKLHPFTSSTISDKNVLKRELKKIRKKGYSADREEFMKGINCIAMPIFDFSNRPVGAVSISVDSDDFANHGVDSLERELRFTSIEISRSMGHALDGERLSIASSRTKSTGLRSE